MLLEVRDLHVEFRTRDGIARAVNGVSYGVDAGETLDVLNRLGLMVRAPRRVSVEAPAPETV